MAVKVNEQTQEEQQQEQQQTKAKEDALTDRLLGDMDLPGGDDESASTNGGEVPPLQTPVEIEEEEEESSESEEEVQDQEDNEEVIPKSKFEKRISQEVAKRKALEARLRNLEESQTSKVSDQRKKLESMSEAELKQLRRTVRSELRKESDPSREAELDSLYDEIDEVMVSAPVRFQQRQVEQFNRAKEEIVTDPDNDGVDFNAGEKKILEIAQNIYNKSPSLQKSEFGQGDALRLAVEHYKIESQTSKGKSKVDNLKRQNTKLKRATALDSSSVKGGSSKASLKKLYDTAKSGGYDEKAEFLDRVVNVDRYLPKHLKKG